MRFQYRIFLVLAITTAAACSLRIPPLEPASEKLIRGMMKMHFVSDEHILNARLAVALSAEGKARFDILDYLGAARIIFYVNQRNIAFFDLTGRCVRKLRYSKQRMQKYIGFDTEPRRLVRLLTPDPWPTERCISFRNDGNNGKSCKIQYGIDTQDNQYLEFIFLPGNRRLKLTWLSRKTESGSFPDDWSFSRAWRKCTNLELTELIP